MVVISERRASLYILTASGSTCKGTCICPVSCLFCPASFPFFLIKSAFSFSLICCTRIYRIMQPFGSFSSWYMLLISCEYSFCGVNSSKAVACIYRGKGCFWLEKLLRKSMCLAIGYVFEMCANVPILWESNFQLHIKFFEKYFCCNSKWSTCFYRAHTTSTREILCESCIIISCVVDNWSHLCGKIWFFLQYIYQPSMWDCSVSPKVCLSNVIIRVIH